MATETGAEDITASLDAVIEDTEDSPTEEIGTEVEVQEGSPESKGKVIPYTRFKEVIETKNNLQEQLEALQGRYDEQSSSLGKLTEMLESTKTDAELLREIQSYQNDPDMLPHLQAIDRKIRGIEEEIEETGTVDDSKIDQVSKLIQKKQSELAENLADHQSDLLTQRADAIADKWLDALPEDYSDQDKQVISKLWAGEVDWDIIERSPDVLQDTLRSSFQSVIDEYGTPRGRLIDPDDPDSYEIEVEEEEVVSPEIELLEAIGKKPYGEIEDGKTAVSDEEFAADMAKMIRLGRE